MRTPIAATIAATTSPANGSRTRQPRSEPPMPTSATTDESASERWCHAFAISTCDCIRSPTRRVAR